MKPAKQHVFQDCQAIHSGRPGAHHWAAQQIHSGSFYNSNYLGWTPDQWIGRRGVVLSSSGVSDVENHRSHLFLLQLLFLFFMMLARGKDGRKLRQSFEESRLSFWGLGWGDPTTTKLFEVKNTLSFQNGHNWTLRARFPTGSLCPVCFCLWKIYYFFLCKYKESLLEGRFSPFSFRHWWKGRGRGCRLNSHQNYLQQRMTPSLQTVCP